MRYLPQRQHEGNKAYAVIDTSNGGEITDYPLAKFDAYDKARSREAKWLDAKQRGSERLAADLSYNRTVLVSDARIILDACEASLNGWGM